MQMYSERIGDTAQPKEILIFGDSNTRGTDGLTYERFSVAQQWPTILQTQLGSGFRVIQEGLPGRTAGEYQAKERRIPLNGQTAFNKVIKHNPTANIVAVILGANDANHQINEHNTFQRAAEQIKKDLTWYAKRAIEFYGNQEVGQLDAFVFGGLPDCGSNSFYEPGEGVVNKVNGFLQRQAQHRLCVPIKWVSLSGLPLSDNLHLTSDSHQRLAGRFEQVIQSIYNLAE